MYNNDWKINETNLVPTACTICGAKSEHSRLNLTETCEDPVIQISLSW
jgi:hypothetical protein